MLVCDAPHEARALPGGTAVRSPTPLCLDSCSQTSESTVSSLNWLQRYCSAACSTYVNRALRRQSQSARSYQRADCLPEADSNARGAACT